MQARCCRCARLSRVFTAGHLAQAAPQTLRAAQVVSYWNRADESEEWGAPAMPRSAVLAQFLPGLARVLMWLAIAPGPLPRSRSARVAATFRKTSLMLSAQVGIIARTSLRLPPNQSKHATEHAKKLVLA